VNADADRRPHVIVRTRPMWRLRITREAPRYALGALSAFGLLASARFAIAPPRAVTVLAPRRATSDVDLAAAGYAVEFTRRYLTWRASEPGASAQGLEPFAGAHMQGAAGLVLPAAGEERVEWAEMVQSREPTPGVHVYTVATQTDGQGLRYLTVPVERTATGSLALSGYPAFVGAPASTGAAPPSTLRPVDDAALEVVVRRALANYLSDSPAELAADLAGGAHVAPPSPPMRLLSAERPQWALGGGAVVTTLQAVDGLGACYTLAYEMDVTRSQGRWEISAIQSNPDA
jgi:hypothetical protein